MESFNEIELRIQMMDFAIRDEETDEIIGLDENAPQYIKEEYTKFLEEINSDSPVVR